MDMNSLPHMSSSARVEEVLGTSSPEVVAVDLPEGHALTTRDSLSRMGGGLTLAEAIIAIATAGDPHAIAAVHPEVVGSVTQDFVATYGTVIVGRRFEGPTPLKPLCPESGGRCDCQGSCRNASKFLT